jgi:hypothetical protein
MTALLMEMSLPRDTASTGYRTPSSVYKQFITIRYRTLSYMGVELERLKSSVADPDPGSGIRCLLDPWIRDP